MKLRTRINNAIGRVFMSAGLEPPRRLGQGHHVDAYEDQVAILRGRRVATIVDGGGNVGETAAGYRKLFPEAKVHSFEPTESSYQQLEKVAQADPSIVPHKLALADRPGTLRFYLNQMSVTNSLLRPADGATDYVVADVMGNVGSTEVEATTLDAFCESNGIASIEVLKLDLQGGELLALTGAERLLSAGAISLIYSEINFAPCYDGQVEFGDLNRFLAERGYPLYNLYNLVPGANGLLLNADGLWVGPEIRESLRR